MATGTVVSPRSTRISALPVSVGVVVNNVVSADGKPYFLWKQGRALASQPESVTKTNIARDRIHPSSNSIQ
ncbi:hypothetical protein [Escherichia coli]|uniref:hypothetical protein n=1 Tax=Escherichia coli TaxID=562 RepID=UPI003985B1B7